MSLKDLSRGFHKNAGFPVGPHAYAQAIPDGVRIEPPDQDLARPQFLEPPRRLIARGDGEDEVCGAGVDAESQECQVAAQALASGYHLPEVRPVIRQFLQCCQRGYLPKAVYSAHWIADPMLREPVERFLEEERAGVEQEMEWLEDAYTPFRQG